MATGFEMRRDAFEAKFAHDEELRFRVIARRNRLLGLWAAGLLGHTGDAAEAYANEVVRTDFEQGGDHDVFRKIRKDFDQAGVHQSDHHIRRKMGELLATATEQVQSQG